MNKSLCVAGLGMACNWAMAQSSVTLAGTVDVGVRHVKNGSVGSLTSEASGSNSTSKLIVRGQEDLGGNLRAGFYLDSTILADMGGAGASAPAGQLRALPARWTTTTRRVWGWATSTPSRSAPPCMRTPPTWTTMAR